MMKKKRGSGNKKLRARTEIRIVVNDPEITGI